MKACHHGTQTPGCPYCSGEDSHIIRALRLALETATRERDLAEAWFAEICEKCAEARNERDEARAERDRAVTIATQEAVGHSRALSALSRPAPVLSPEVREAAGRLREALCAVPSWQALLPASCGVCEGEPDCSGEHEPCGCHETLLVVESALALLAAFDAVPAPEPLTHAMRRCEVK